MKISFLAASFIMATLISCSHTQESKRVPARVDVGVIASPNEILLYFKEGNYIKVRKCESNTLLGFTSAEAKANCQGKTVRVPIEAFKQAIRKVVSTGRLNFLQPLTPDEVKAFVQDGPTPEQVQIVQDELDRINAFIANYGDPNSTTLRREELLLSLRNSATRMSAIKKVNDEVERAISLIANQTELTLVKYNPDNNQFLYTVLLNFDPSQKVPCGISGPVAERIRDCSDQPTSKTEHFVLVTRTNDYMEVHKDTQTGLLWSEVLPATMRHHEAQAACNGNLKQVAKLTSFAWRLPTDEDYKEAEQNGLRRAMHFHGDSTWSATIYNPSFAGAFLDGFGWVAEAQRSGWRAVRCVAQLR